MSFLSTIEAGARPWWSSTFAITFTRTSKVIVQGSSATIEVVVSAAVVPAVGTSRTRVPFIVGGERGRGAALAPIVTFPVISHIRVRIWGSCGVGEGGG